MARKLQCYEESGSDRHLRDISAMLEISGEKMVLLEVEASAQHLGFEEAFWAARSFNR